MAENARKIPLTDSKKDIPVSVKWDTGVESMIRILTQVHKNVA